MEQDDGDIEMGDTGYVDDSDVESEPHGIVGIRDGADHVRDVVVEVKDGGQTDQREQLQNDADNEITDCGEEQVAFQFVQN